MQIVTPTNTFQDVYVLSGFAAGTSLIVTNNSSHTIYLNQSTLAPTNRESTYAVNVGQSVVIHGNEQKLWLSGDGGHVLVQNITGTISPFSSVDLPHDLYTSNAEGFRRLRIDPGQTGFWEGREARTFFEFNIPAGQVQTFKFTSPIDFVLFEQTLSVDAGSVRFQAIVGATEVATFGTALPVIGKNRMASRRSPYYDFQITINTHASPVALNSDVTGGTVVESFRVVAANATAQQQTVSGGAQSERGLAGGSYYLRLHNFGSGAATGTYTLFFEERP